MISTFIMLSLIIKELEANEISTLKSLWYIHNVNNFPFTLRIYTYSCNLQQSFFLLLHEFD